MTAPTPRNYNNITSVGTLSGPASPSDPVLSVTDLTNWPTPPFTATVERNTVNEEIVLVTAVNGGGTSLTVTRGYDGTAAQTHLSGATVEHTAIARDFREANQHTTASTGVHGTEGALVGTEGTQTIQDKEFVSTVHTADTVLGDAIVAYIPTGAESRNAFRAMDGSGNDVATIDAAGNAQLRKVTGTVAPTGTNDLTTKAYVDGLGASAATANTIARRDANGDATFRLVTQNNAPSNPSHLTRKDYVDSAAATATTNANNYTDVTAGTAAATNGALVRRDTNGRAKFADPAVAADAATKSYVDASTVNGAWQSLTLNTAGGYSQDSVGNTVSGRLMADGSTVQLRGTALKGAIGNGDVIATLPVGLRPAASYKVIACGGGDSLVNVNIFSNGQVSVRFWQGSNMAVPSNMVSLDGIWFAL